MRFVLMSDRDWQPSKKICSSSVQLNMVSFTLKISSEKKITRYYNYRKKNRQTNSILFLKKAFSKHSVKL